MLKIRAEIDDANEYAIDEIKLLTKSLSAELKKKINKELININLGTNWFVGFVDLSIQQREKVREIFINWADSEGIGTEYCISEIK